MGSHRAAFPLPNGSCLRFTLRWVKGGQQRWPLTSIGYLTPEILSGPKERLPIVGLWNSGTAQHLVAADFDDLPEGFASWDNFYQFCYSLFRHIAVVTRSPSQKVKIFFVITFSHPQEMTRAIALETLEAYLLISSHDLFECIDNSCSALATARINKSIFEGLSEAHSLIPLDAIGEEIDETFNKYNNSNGSLTQHSGPLHEEVSQWVKGDGRREKFIRILLASFSLCSKEGFDIPQTKFGRECNVTPMAIGNWLRRLRECGWLRLVDPNYERGKKAMTYVAAGHLREEILKLIEDRIDEKQSLTEITDGKWNSTLGQLSYHGRHQAKGEFLQSIKRIEGAYKKDRIRQAGNWFDWHQKCVSSSKSKK